MRRKKPIAARLDIRQRRYRRRRHIERIGLAGDPVPAELVGLKFD